MSRKNTKIRTYGLVTLLVLSGLSAIFVGFSVAVSTGDSIEIDSPIQGECFLEYEMIYVHVTDDHDEDEQGVFVELVGTSVHDYTNLQGIAKFLAPSVNADTPYTIKATKDNHVDQVDITIRNRALDIKIVPNTDIPEEQSFEVSVLDQHGKDINGVWVTFDCDLIPSYQRVKNTGSDNKVTFEAPNLNGADITCDIKAQKMLYDSDVKEVTIKNMADPVTIQIRGIVMYDDLDNGWMPASGVSLMVDGEELCVTNSDGTYGFFFTEEEGIDVYTLSASMVGDLEDSIDFYINQMNEINYFNLALRNPDVGGSVEGQSAPSGQQQSAGSQTLN